MVPSSLVKTKSSTLVVWIVLNLVGFDTYWNKKQFFIVSRNLYSVEWCGAVVLQVFQVVEVTHYQNVWTFIRSCSILIILFTVSSFAGSDVGLLYVHTIASLSCFHSHTIHQALSWAGLDGKYVDAFNHVAVYGAIPLPHALSTFILIKSYPSNRNQW